MRVHVTRHALQRFRERINPDARQRYVEHLVRYGRLLSKQEASCVAKNYLGTGKCQSTSCWAYIRDGERWALLPCQKLWRCGEWTLMAMTAIRALPPSDALGELTHATL